MTTVQTRDELLTSLIRKLWSNLDNRKPLMLTKSESDLLNRVLNGG